MAVREEESARAADTESLWSTQIWNKHNQAEPWREQKVENYDKDPEVKSLGLDSRCEGLCRKCTDPQNS